jgi:hypothetical protein
MPACAAAGVLSLYQRYGQQKDGGREKKGGGFWICYRNGFGVDEEDWIPERDRTSSSRQVEAEMRCLCVD